jgi:hypothetical protein
MRRGAQPLDEQGGKHVICIKKKAFLPSVPPPDLTPNLSFSTIHNLGFHLPTKPGYEPDGSMASHTDPAPPHSGKAHPSRACLRHTPLVFDQEALRASARPLVLAIRFSPSHVHTAQWNPLLDWNNPNVLFPRAGLPFWPVSAPSLEKHETRITNVYSISYNR